MTNRLQTLERERQRLERQLARNPQWRAMRAVGGVPQHIAGEWQFPGLNRVQANALRQSLLFGAYQEVVAGIEALHTGRANVPVGAAPGGADGGAAPREPELLEQPKREGAGVRPKPDPTPEPLPKPASGPASELAPAAAFRTRVKIKSDPSSLVTTEARGAAAPTASVQPADDLTRIRRIDQALARRLAAAGVTSFAQMAAWSSSEVRRVARELELGKRIWRENWIEQAAVLAMRAERAALAEATRMAAEATSAPGAEAPVRDAMVAAPVADDTASPPVIGLAVTRILIDKDADTRWAAPAQTSDSPAAIAIAAPDDDREPTPEPAVDLAAGPTQPCVPDGPSEPAPEPMPVMWGAACKVGRRARRLPAPSLRRLTYIRGISDTFADDLVAAGVRSIAEIAQWSAADVRWFRAVLGEGARISADQWIEQAQILAGGDWTRHALRLVNGDFSSLITEPPRSVSGAPSPVGRPIQAATARDRGQDAEALAVRAPLAPTEHAGDTVRRTPPPLPQIQTETMITGPVVIEPIDIILRGLIRRGGRAPVTGEAATPSGVAAQREPVAADATERRALDDRKAKDGGAIGVTLEVSGPVAAPAKPDTVEPEPEPAATGAAPEAPADDRPIVAQADTAPPLKVAAPVSAEAPDETLAREPVEPLAEPASAADSRPAPDEASGDIRAAEVLVVIRKPAATDVTAAVPDALEAAIEAGSSSYGVDQDAFGDELGPPGAEAAVTIVARQRPPAEAEVRSMVTAGRERPGYSPEFIARRLGARDEDDRADGEAYAAYHDAVEEATVTIIRARASEEPVSSVMPDRAANDQPPTEAAPVENEPTRKKGALGLRFLRALTGE